ncbi:hypothetical protein BDZ97DRAFT_1761618 [Flammula alnicola]|nr:hypothetical protein BDZ97DRAFT_1761618 [Flammula alnicola]
MASGCTLSLPDLQFLLIRSGQYRWYDREVIIKDVSKRYTLGYGLLNIAFDRDFQINLLTGSYVPIGSTIEMQVTTYVPSNDELLDSTELIPYKSDVTGAKPVFWTGGQPPGQAYPSKQKPPHSSALYAYNLVLDALQIGNIRGTNSKKIKILVMLKHKMGQLCVTGLACNLNIFHQADLSDTNLQMVLLASPRYSDQDLKRYLEYHISTLTSKKRCFQKLVFKSNIISALADLFVFNMFDCKTTQMFVFKKLNSWRRYQTTIMQEFTKHAVDVFSFLSAFFKQLPGLEHWNSFQHNGVSKAFREPHHINHDFLSTNFLAILNNAYKAHLAHHFNAYLNSMLQSDDWNRCYKEYADYVMAKIEAWLLQTNQQGADYPCLHDELTAYLSHMLYGDYVENHLMKHFSKGSKYVLLCVSFLKDLDHTVSDTEKGAIEQQVDLQQCLQSSCVVSSSTL